MARVTEEQKQEALQLYQEGMLPKVIAERLGFSMSAVYKLVQDAGIYIKRKTGSRSYSLNESYFDEIDTEAKAYILGLLCADAGFDVKCNRVKLALKADDVHILSRILYEVGSDAEPRAIPAKNQFYISLNSSRMMQRFHELGLAKLKADGRGVGTLSHIPLELHRHFIRGYFDGDGCALIGVKYSSGEKNTLTTIGTRELLEDTFEKVFPSPGGLKKYASCNMWRHVLSKKAEVKEFLAYMYEGSTIHLNRKYEKYECAHVKPCELLEALT